MKKLFAILALVLGMVSCQNEPEALDVVVGGEQEVMLSVSLPEGTRANSAEGFDLTNLGNYSIRYILEISYNGNLIRDVQISKEKSVKFPVRLAPNRDYTFTVWADLVTAISVDKENWYNADLYYNTEGGLKNIYFKDWTPNTEARDAWTATQTVTYTSSNKNISLELKRPFAKVRVVATDIAEIRKFGIEPTNAVAAYTTSEMYTEFDAVAGAAKGETTGKTHTFNYVVDTYEGANGDQLTLFADYVLVPADGNVQFTLSVFDNTKGANALIKTNNFNTTIPVVANKVTSIVGNILTEGGDVKVTVDGVLGNHETFKYIDTAENLLAAMNENGNFILGGNIELSDAPVAGQASRRNTANEAKKTTIDLNGYTITINNKSDKPLVTVAEGNTLTFAGAGNIVMTSESTAPFVENKNENGGVIIEEATVTNESTNQEATIVDGAAVVNEGVEIEGNAVSGETTSQLDYVLANGGEVTLLQDVTSDKILEISATNPVVINGNGKTLTSTAGRAINVSGAENVTIKNLNIVASGERAINVIQNSKKVTIENVTATAANYTVNVAGSAPGAVVAIKNSTLNGLCTVNVASAEAYVTVDGSTVNCNDNNTTAGESYAALCLNKNAVGGKIIATNSTINVTEGSDSTAGRNGAENGVVTINGSVEGVVVTYAVITYPGSDNYYGFQTIAEAVEFAKNGDTISLIRDVELTELLTISNGKNVVLDLNGKTINGKTSGATNPQDLFLVNGNLTVKDGTITAEHIGANMGWGGQGTIFNITAGGVVTLNNVNAKYLGGTDMGFVAHLNNWGEVTLNVENSTLESNYVAVRVFNSGYDMNNVTIKNSTLKGGSYAFWVHNYTVADFGTEEKAKAQKALLNFDIFNGTNTFIGKNETPIRYGMTNAIYTAPGAAIVSTAEELEAALQNNASVVNLLAGEYEMPQVQLQGKSLTIKGSKDVVIDASKIDARNQFVTGATLAFEGVTINFGKDLYMGFANTASLKYKNCHINGLQFLFGENVEFENCTFNSNVAEHSVWTYGVKNVSFTDCDFTYGDRCVNCYSDNDVVGGKQTVNFTNCTFTTENTASEGAVEINSCFFSVGIEVNLKGCTAPAYGEMAWVSRWDSTNGAKTTINIK